jgi:hypothetical protein
MHEIRLNGIDGGNLLGFMAALGTLRLLAADAGEVRMKWQESAGRGWVPAVVHPQIATGQELTDLIARRVCGSETCSPAWDIGNDLTLGRGDFGARLGAAAADSEPGRRDVVDFLAAFGSEAVGAGPKKDLMSDTEFRTMSGAGHQHFLGFMRELAASAGSEHIRRTLFESWDYADDRPSLRWDPADYRPHALRSEDPSGDPIKTMRGANRLAIEALPLFPTVPVGRKLRTVGFQDRDGETEFTWPMWTESLSLETVSSLLASGEIQCDAPERASLTRRGVGQVFRAKRFTEGKYRNFSPARALL